MKFRPCCSLDVPRGCETSSSELDGSWQELYGSWQELDGFWQELETVVGRAQMLDYIRREQVAEGDAIVRMGTPILEGNCVVGEFLAKMTKPDERGTLIGCFIAQLDAETGRCAHFRQYWREVPRHLDPYPGWGAHSLDH